MRCSYYGCQGLFQNYISNRPNGADGAAGLGLGHQGATGLNLFFQWFCYGTSQHHTTAISPANIPHQSHPFLVPSSPINILVNTTPF
jgi:hypothetical protein